MRGFLLVLAIAMFGFVGCGDETGPPHPDGTRVELSGDQPLISDNESTLIVEIFTGDAQGRSTDFAIGFIDSDVEGVTVDTGVGGGSLYGEVRSSVSGQIELFAVADDVEIWRDTIEVLPAPATE